MTPYKSMTQKSNQDLRKKYPYIRTGTLDILTKHWLFAVRQNTSKIHIDIKFSRGIDVHKQNEKKLIIYYLFTFLYLGIA